MNMRLIPRFVMLGGLWLVLLPAVAQTSAHVSVAADERSISQWLLRMHEASRRRSYIGTLVVSAGGRMSSSRVWHVCDGQQQMERVESLTGAPRSTFRRNDEVVTFSPQSRLAVTERRESLGLFPHLLKAGDEALARYYSVARQGSERAAGLESDVVQLLPRDRLRFGYRIWSEQRTGLVVKMQTLDAEGQVLEQVAFSELQLDAPVSMDKLGRMMAQVEGYRVESPVLMKTTPAAEGWRLAREVPGFRAMSCHRRASSVGQHALQWVFSDGLASLSLFIEPYDPGRHAREEAQGLGATHALSKRLVARDGPWWLTLVGEVPPATLQAFALAVERMP